MIEGVVIKDLTVHTDERGRLFEILRDDDPFFTEFGQAYVTVCNPGWVKAWHYHKEQADRFCCVKGKMRVVLYDGREKSATKGEVNEFLMDSSDPKVIVIPKGVVHGMECVGEEEAMVLNMPDKHYEHSGPDEHRLALDSEEVPYEGWRGKKGW